MEVNSENYNNDINLSNIINNQNDYNSQQVPIEKPIEYPFQLITKEQEKKEDILPINEQEKLKKNLYKIESIPEINEEKIQKKKSIKIDSFNTTDKQKIEKDKIKENEEKKKLKKKINLNFLSPEIYMRKKFEHTEQNINPVEIKLKKIEKEIQNQFDYDYQRVMQDVKDKLNAIKKNKDQQKHILEGEQKLKEKIKTMEEYRENKMKEKAQKILKKQNKNSKSLKKIKGINKSNANIDSKNSYINTDGDNNKNYIKTLESTNMNKLPPLSKSSKKYILIRERKEEIEKEFILNTKEDILSLEKEHKENYIYQYNKAKSKIKQHNKLYTERNEAYSKYRDDKEKEKNDIYLQKDIKRRYNVKLNLIRDRSEKSGRLKEHIQKNLENFQEKKEIIKKKEKKRIKEYLKKINKYNKDSKNLVNNNEKRIKFSNLQKKNINNVQKEFEERYNDLLWKQENIKNIAFDMQRIDSNNKKNLYQNSLRIQNENEKKYQSFNEFLDKIEKNNIVNKTDNVKLKIYNKKVKEELEERNRKLEELNK